MRGILRYFLLNLILLSFFLSLKGQPGKLINGSFDKYTFDQFVKAVETQTDYKLYYDPAELDTFSVSLKADNMPLDLLLDKLFSSTDIHFAVDSYNRVFISHRFQMKTELPDKFPRQKPMLKDSITEADIPGDIQLTAKDKLNTSVEKRIFEIGPPRGNAGQGSATLAGYIREIRTGEPLPGVSVYVDSTNSITNTDQYGYYSLSMPKGRHVIKVSSIGMKDTRRQIILYADGKLDIELQEYVASLKGVTVISEKTSNTRSLQMGTTRLSIKSIKQVPVVFGEADVLKVLLTLPGVTSAGEAANGFNVRGGSADQNLILFNDATIYNPSHLFGFFSAFNPDVVKGMELYKSAIPEKYGGRLSSVLDVTMQEGNSKEWSGVAGIGPLTGKLTIGGPIKKEKTTVIAGLRATYSNWLLKLVPENAYKNSKADFNDLSLHLSHIINPKNTLYITAYISNDAFRLNNDTAYKYGNKNINIKWKHLFTNRFSNVVTAGTDYYRYAISSSQNPVNAFKLGFNIRQFTFRSDFTYAQGNKHTINFGINTVHYRLTPGSFEPVGLQSLIKPKVLPAEQGLETAIYLGDKFLVNSKLSVTAGIRFSVFNYLGPATINNYVPGLPRDTTTVLSMTNYKKGKIIKTYRAPEIRLGMRYNFSENTSLKLSFNTMQQYIHMLSNTITISPTDTWKLSDPNIKPQRGAQLSLGIYRNFKSNTIETSAEVYYKRIQNYLDYKNGASLLLNEQIETDLVTTKGKAYGVELLIKKISGKINGWLSYTYSRTFLQLDDPIAGQTINRGNFYPASFDKPHSVNFIGNYRFSHRYSMSLNVVYSTGRPITLPIAVFNQGSSSSLLYSDRNQYRIPDYFRTDLSFNLEGNHKVKQKTHNSWSFGVYNLTARQNAYSVYFIQENGKVKGYQLSIFGTVIPFLTYNIKF
jgi:CarboxypepD_reg-like domain/TonB-dependent Receptor Plug Domain